MSTNKTTPQNNSVNEFLNSIADGKRKVDSQELVKLMQDATKAKPAMWGSAIVGFGQHHYNYESGREGDIMAVGFSPRKQALVVYGVIYYDLNAEENSRLAKELGPHTTGKGCLYIKDLSLVDKSILSKMISTAFKAKNNA